MAPRGPTTAWFWRITATAAACSLICCVLCLRQTPNFTPVLLRESQQASDLSSAPLVAIGDLHGDLFQAQTALALAGLADADGNWRGGSSTLVQTGDLLDRGPDSLALVHLFENLKASAIKTGGRVHTLLGNHEVMNLMGDYRYVNPAELAALENSDTPLPAASHKKGLDIWSQNMHEEHAVGKALRQRAAAVVLGHGNCRTLFIHAGLSPQVLQTLLKQSEITSTALLKKLNALISDAVMDCSTGTHDKCSDKAAALITAPDSVVWYRGYVHQYERELCPQVKRVLQAMQVQRVVAGHNVMSNGRIKSLCGGKVHLIDVGMSRAYLGNMAVWKCVNNTAYAVHPGGKEWVLKLTDPISFTPTVN